MLKVDFIKESSHSDNHDIAGVEIKDRPIIQEHHFLGKDDHVLTGGSPSDELIFAPFILLYEEGPQSFGWDYHVLQ
jgi:hypothetical protein